MVALATDVIWSRRASTDFIPDGNLNKRIWVDAQQMCFERDAFQDRAYPEIETSVATMWTPHNLYLAYRCRFLSLHTFEEEESTGERWELWNRDVVEAFISPSPVTATHYYEFELAPNNQWLDLEIEFNDGQPSPKDWNSGFCHATQIDTLSRVWTAEIRIPVEPMGVREIDASSQWRINLCRSDGPSNDRRFLSWRRLDPSRRSFHQPMLFGRLRFLASEI